MYATRETKSAAKAQKKTQKVTKKQQQKQQQQNGIKIGSTTKSPPSAKNPTQTNSTTTNNNNNNIVPNNNKDPPEESTNTSQKFRTHYEAERRATVTATTLPSLPGYENVAKMERSNSFSLRTKLSKFINHLTGSKENLSRSEEDAESGRTPFTFTRSRSMILMRRPNRRSFIEPQLEQLSEETEKSGGDLTSPASPRKTSVAEESPVLMRRGEVTGSVRTPTRRQSAHPITSTPLDEVSSVSVPAVQRKASLMSDNPQLNFQKRRSNTLIASFKSTFSGLAGGGGGGIAGSGGGASEKKDKMNPKWSASLQSLQAIDNMVSYANMSFIDYDKFNGYEKQLERQQSLMSLAEQPLPVATQLPLPASAMTHSHSPSPSLPVPLVSPMDETVARTVVMRRNKRGNSSSSTSLAARTSLDTDYEHNLDKVHNVYRESLDSRTLELLNLRSRNSFIQDQPLLFDALNLEDGSVERRCKLCSQRVVRSGSMKQQHRDAVDGRGNPKKQVSETHRLFHLIYPGKAR